MNEEELELNCKNRSNNFISYKMEEYIILGYCSKFCFCNKKNCGLHHYCNDMCNPKKKDTMQKETH
jgi:hypothetical protein